MSAPRSNFSFPTKVLYGPGTISDLPQKLRDVGISKPLVVTDGGILATEAFTLLKSALGEAGQGKTWFLYAGVHPNPVEADVTESAAAYRQNGCDGVIAFGGGSALDVGKAARLLIKRPDQPLSKFRYEDDWSGLVPCICIPTTAGTGSDVGRSSVITMAATGRKAVFFHPELLARQVILDAQLTAGLPPRLTAATGADAIVHCIESFTSPVFHPICDGVALEGIHLAVEALPKAVKNGKDLEARGHMLVAAAMGAIAFQKDLGATHSLAHPLSTICGLHHGTANALCLAVVMRFNSARKPGLYRRVGLACGLDVVTKSDADADRLTIEFFEKFMITIDLKPGLRAYGVDESKLEALADQAIEDPCHATNPVPVTRQDFLDMYKAAL